MSNQNTPSDIAKPDYQEAWNFYNTFTLPRWVTVRFKQVCTTKVQRTIFYNCQLCFFFFVRR